LSSPTHQDAEICLAASENYPCPVKDDSPVLIWCFPDDAFPPKRLFMTQKVAETSPAKSDIEIGTDKYPRYLLVYRRIKCTSVNEEEEEELLGEIKVERRTSLAELRRMITEVLIDGLYLYFVRFMTKSIVAGILATYGFQVVREAFIVSCMTRLFNTAYHQLMSLLFQN
jgi:hypothetical protein